MCLFVGVNIFFGGYVLIARRCPRESEVENPDWVDLKGGKELKGEPSWNGSRSPELVEFENGLLETFGENLI